MTGGQLFAHRGSGALIAVVQTVGLPNPRITHNGNTVSVSWPEHGQLHVGSKNREPRAGQRLGRRAATRSNTANGTNSITINSAGGQFVFPAVTTVAADVSSAHYFSRKKFEGSSQRLPRWKSKTFTLFQCSHRRLWLWMLSKFSASTLYHRTCGLARSASPPLAHRSSTKHRVFIGALRHEFLVLPLEQRVKAPNSPSLSIIATRSSIQTDFLHAHRHRHQPAPGCARRILQSPWNTDHSVVTCAFTVSRNQFHRRTPPRRTSRRNPSGFPRATRRFLRHEIGEFDFDVRRGRGSVFFATSAECRRMFST